MEFVSEFIENSLEISKFYRYTRDRIKIRVTALSLEGAVTNPKDR